MMSREAFKYTAKVLSNEEKKKKLEDNDATFTNNDPNFGQDINDYELITPERKYTFKGFLPNYKEKFHPIKDILSNIKMNKNQYFFKIFNHKLEVPIYILLRLMEKADYFPEAMRTSMLTFLDSGRAIFSLEALAKVVEVTLSISFGECLKEHYRIHGDPLQMAYKKSQIDFRCLSNRYLVL